MLREVAKPPAMQWAVKAAWVKRGGLKPGVKRGCNPAPALFPCGNLRACLDDSGHQDTGEGERKGE